MTQEFPWDGFAGFMLREASISRGEVKHWVLCRAIVALHEENQILRRRVQRLAKNQRVIIDHIPGLENPPDGLDDED